jgi:cytochrome c-type biogenesis protein CcmH/NrfG
LNSDPDNFRAWNNLGMAYKEEKEFNPAEKAFQKALRRNPDYAPPIPTWEIFMFSKSNMKRP